MEIEWYPGRCLTQKILKKKPKKGSKNAKPITKTENCESFFKFFNPPQVPEDEDDIDEDTVSINFIHAKILVEIIENFWFPSNACVKCTNRQRNFKTKWSKTTTLGEPPFLFSAKDIEYSDCI